MILQVLIAHYKEPEEIVQRLLDSIKLQQNINFNNIEIIIANDGAEVLLSEDFLKSYPFNCKYFILEHGGISKTRNALLKAATANYIMLCDCDDIFIDLFSFYYILSSIKKNPNSELFSYNFYEELYDDKNDTHYYRPHPYDIFCIHGKVFKRDWLIDNNIFYQDSQYCFGDTYFVGLCARLCTNKSYCEKPIYLWKYNKDSVSRMDNYFIVKFKMKLLSDELLIDELLKRKCVDGAKEAVLFMLYESYYMTTYENWVKGQEEETRIICEEILKKLIKKYEELLASCNRLEHARVLNIVANNYLKSAAPLPNKSFEEWLKYYGG